MSWKISLLALLTMTAACGAFAQTIYKTIGPYTKSTWCEESLAQINSGSMDVASRPDISSPLANYQPKAP